MDALSGEIATELVLTLVLTISRGLTFGCGFAKAWRNAFAFIVLLAASRQGKREHYHCDV